MLWFCFNDTAPTEIYALSLPDALPIWFLDEAQRALRVGGRVLILDPYCSVVSTAAYRRFHHERTDLAAPAFGEDEAVDRKSTRLNSSHANISYAVFCLKKKKILFSRLL